MDTNKSVTNDLPDLQAYWMPFTANRQFKRDPRFVTEAEGMYYTTHTGRRVLDGVSGLWCCNAGHCHPHIVAAIQEQAAIAGLLHGLSDWLSAHVRVGQPAGRDRA